jgi:hypothetical protein
MQIWPPFFSSNSTAQARRAPEVGDGELVLRVVGLVEQVGVERVEAGELGAVDRLDELLLRERRHHVVRRHDDVVPGHPGLELLVNLFVGVVGVDDELDARLVLELLDDRIRQVFGPDVDVERLRVGVAGARILLTADDDRGGGQREGEAERDPAGHVRISFPRCCPDVVPARRRVGEFRRPSSRHARTAESIQEHHLWSLLGILAT